MSEESDQTVAHDTVAPDAHHVARAPRSDRVAQGRNRLVRTVVLTVVLVAITAIGYLHQNGAGFRPVGVDALCPFGGIETAWSLVSGGTLLRRIAVSSIILLVSSVGIALLMGRAFCGNICPLGAVQEFFGKIGHAIWKRDRPVMPVALDGPARWLKYLVLGFFALWTFQAADLVIRPYDPWVAWMHLTSGELFTEFGIGAAVLGVSLAGSIVYDRFFCKYLCPMGATLAPLGKASWFKIRRDADTCTSCRLCDAACPVNIEVSKVDAVTSGECIACNECVNACPVSETLAISTPGARPRTLSAGAALALSVGLFAAVVVVTSISGAFAWTMPTLGEGGSEGRGAGTEAGSTGAPVNVEDIRGYMTFAEVSAATGIPAADFIEYFGVTEAEMALPMKEIAEPKGFDVHTDVREWVAAKMAQGATGGTGEVPPPPH